MNAVSQSVLRPDELGAKGDLLYFTLPYPRVKRDLELRGCDMGIGGDGRSGWV